MPVPQGQRKHADGALERLLHAPGVEGRQQGLGIGMALPGRCPALLLQFLAQGQMVVDLAVENDDQTPRGRLHRLMPRRRQVDDGQPPVRKPQARVRIHPGPCIVRPPVDDGTRHL